MIECEKLSFDSFEEAQKVINKAKRMRVFQNGKRVKKRSSYKPQRAYKCPKCGKIHLTSLKKWK